MALQKTCFIAIVLGTLGEGSKYYSVARDMFCRNRLHCFMSKSCM